MKLRFRNFVLTLVLFAPVVARAGGNSQDPDGLVYAAPTWVDWLDAVVGVVITYLGA